MPTVIIRINPPLTKWLGLADDGKRMTIEQVFESGACIRDVISRLSELYPNFRANALDPETDQLVWNVVLALNEQFLYTPDAYDLVLKEQDEIIFFSAYVGG
jgi:molybdopterin converting factor small subunit